VRLNELGRLRQLAGLETTESEQSGRDWDKRFQDWEEVQFDRGWEVEHNDSPRGYEMIVTRDDGKKFIVSINPGDGGTIESMQGGRGRSFTTFEPETIADMIDSMK